MEDASDEQLMADVAEGDQRAFHRLAERHIPRGLALARRLTGSGADAEEIVQEALIRVWVNAPRWRPTAAFRSWFHRIVVNLCLDRTRRTRWTSLDAAGDPADPASDAVTMIDREETRQAVEKALADLPDRQRAALVLTYYEGLGNAETATTLGTSVPAVEALLIRARRFLRNRLAMLRTEHGATRTEHGATGNATKGKGGTA
jgi:RNA polymerase sigma-70 factor (ECF subfamily)